MSIFGDVHVARVFQGEMTAVRKSLLSRMTLRRLLRKAVLSW